MKEELRGTFAPQCYPGKSLGEKESQACWVLQAIYWALLISSHMAPHRACHLSLFYEWGNEVILGKNKKSNLGLADPTAHEFY